MKQLFLVTGTIAAVALFLHTIFTLTDVAPGTVGTINTWFSKASESQPAGLLVTSPGESQGALVSTALNRKENEPRVRTDIIIQEPEETNIVYRPRETKSGVTYHTDTRFLGSHNIEEETEDVPTIEEKAPTKINSDTFDYGDTYRPNRITMDSISVDASIVIPHSTDIEVLDEALTRGVVYYPGSARFGERGNAFLFGHSSWLPFVRNKNFEVFNELPKLSKGDLVIIHSEGKKFVYRVTSKHTAGHDELWVDFSDFSSKKLTLSTCDSFGAKTDRIVVEAELVEPNKAFRL